MDSLNEPLAPVVGPQKNRNYKSIAPRLLEGSVDLRRLFDQPGELELEIGFGKGNSILERARQRPHSNLVGIEVKPKLAFKVAATCEKQALSNVRIYAADAAEALPRFEPDQALQRVFIHFPDPWWKKRHHKRRVVTPALLSELARLLQSGGELFMQTDVEERAMEYRALVGNAPAFRLRGPEGWLESNPYGARSNREVRAERDGLPIWRIGAHRV